MNFQRPRKRARPTSNDGSIDDRGGRGGLIVTFTRDPSDDLLHASCTYEDAAALFKLRSGWNEASLFSLGERGKFARNAVLSARHPREFLDLPLRFYVLWSFVRCDRMMFSSRTMERGSVNRATSVWWFVETSRTRLCNIVVDKFVIWNEFLSRW